MDTIGQRLKHIRTAQKLTQQAVYEATGISTGNLSGIENGSSEPSAKALVALCKFFNISADYILFGDNATTAYTPDEVSIISNYRKLSPKQQASLQRYISDMAADDPKTTSSEKRAT